MANILPNIMQLCTGLGNRILSIYGSFFQLDNIYCNMLFSYIAMIAICALRISQYIAYLSISQYIANILQYVVYCNNILYIATIFKISRQYLVYRDNISRYIAIHPEYIAMSSKVYSATAIYHSSNASSSSSST